MPVAGPTYPLANNDANIIINTRFISQGFLTDSSNHGLYDLTFQMQKIGSPTGNIYVAIFDDDGTNRPNEMIENGLSQTILDVSTISGVVTSYTFNFFTNPPFLAANTRYHFVIMSDGILNGIDDVRVRDDGSIPAFADGNVCFYDNGSTSWILNLDGDIGFTSQYTDVTPAAPVDNSIVDLDWTCDCDDQDGVMEDNLSDITNLKTAIINKLRITLYAYLPYFPGQGYWESEWVKRGYSLPIDDGVNLLWYDTGNNIFGGSYTIVGGDVKEIIYKLPKGTIYNISRSAGIMSNEDVNLSNNYAGTVSTTTFVNLNVIVPSYLRFNIVVYANGTVGWNYFLGGVNQYNTEFGTALNTDHYSKFVGPASPAWSPFQVNWQHYTTLAVNSSLSFQIRYISPTGTGRTSAYRATASHAANPAGNNDFSTVQLSTCFLVVA